MKQILTTRASLMVLYDLGQVLPVDERLTWARIATELGLADGIDPDLIEIGMRGRYVLRNQDWRRTTKVTDSYKALAWKYYGTYYKYEPDEEYALALVQKTLMREEAYTDEVAAAVVDAASYEEAFGNLLDLLVGKHAVSGRRYLPSRRAQDEAPAEAPWEANDVPPLIPGSD